MTGPTRGDLMFAAMVVRAPKREVAGARPGTTRKEQARKIDALRLVHRIDADMGQGRFSTLCGYQIAGHTITADDLGWLPYRTCTDCNKERTT